MLTQRQELVLKLIVDEFVRSADPVGSKTLANLLNVSSATIRNEMVELEELGLIEKTHTSSGRVPSDTGYHYYIENLLSANQNDNESYTVIDELFSNKDIKRDEAIKQAMNLLSQLTNYTTIALGPSAYGSKVKKVELVPLTEDTCILLVVTNQGHVESKQIMVPENTTLEDMKRVIEVLNDIVYDCPINQVSEKLHYEMNAARIEDILSYNQTIIDSFLEAFTKFTQSKYYLSGKNKVLYQPEFSDLHRVRELLTFFEQNDIFRLVENTESQGMNISIGKDNQVVAMRDCTVITVPYDLNDDESGTIAIVGPTRMEYQKVIPLVKYLASHMSKLYKRRK